MVQKAKSFFFMSTWMLSPGSTEEYVNVRAWEVTVLGGAEQAINIYVQ